MESTKKCKVCGRELTLDHFKRVNLAKDGRAGVCNSCSLRRRKENAERKIDYAPPQKVEGGNPDLAMFTPVELIAELKVRGYRGKLSVVREVTL